MISASIAVVAVDGARARPDRGVRLRRRTAVGAGIALAESFTYASNNHVCPLTPLAEELGAGSGSLTDLYLPRWMSDRVPQQEQKILALVAEGKTNKEIASEVFLSDKSAKHYISSILAKLNLERRGQAAAYVARLKTPIHD